MQQQSDQQLNIEEVEPAPVEQMDNLTDDGSSTTDLQDTAEHATGQVKTKSKIGKFWDIALWVLIAVLAISVLLRAFVYVKITISGESMTSSYYNDESSPYYNAELTYHSGDTVRVIKLAKPKRGDVAVFYKYRVDSKFKAMFARGDDVMSGGKYEKLIKRVVAVAGDKIWLELVSEEEKLYRLVIVTANGEKLYENYYEKNGQKLDEEAFRMTPNSLSGLGILTDYTEDTPYVVREGYFFAMGDNRADSSDSRILGAISMDQLYGVVWE